MESTSCAWCVPPFPGDPRQSHGICERHLVEMLDGDAARVAADGGCRGCETCDGVTAEIEAIGGGK